MGEPIFIPVSAGELLDKKTILEIKSQRIQDSGQLANVNRELALLASIAQGVIGQLNPAVGVGALETELRQINSELWDLENAVRACERSGAFGEAFVQLARKIYAGNDRRAAVKRQINTVMQSPIVEEKSHG